MNPWLASRLGYDPARVAELPAHMQRALALVALASAPAVVVLTLSAAWGAYLTSGSVPMAIGVGAFAAFYLLNLLRVAVAGGGVGPQQPYAQVTTWMPRTVPLVMLGFLGLFFAQPVTLAVLKQEHDPRIEALRRSLETLHAEATLQPLRAQRSEAEAALAATQKRLDAALELLGARQRELSTLAPATPGRGTVERALADDRRSVTRQTEDVARLTTLAARARDLEALAESHDVEPYRRHLAQSHFLLRRVQLTWERPLRPGLMTALMMLLMVLPWLASATLARTASRAYEANRWKSNRALIDAAHAEARRAVAQALSQWPTYAGPRLELHEDAPYDTKPRAGAGRYEARHG
ncbi:MAG: hypothetical protein Q8S33_14470 [Myxococcales bacterium]|nr:hypothetical protein [Myxococcales bacterium]